MESPFRSIRRTILPKTILPKTIPLRRLSTPDDLARLVVWLGSDANTYVSGQTISLNGGDQR